MMQQRQAAAAAPLRCCGTQHWAAAPRVQRPRRRAPRAGVIAKAAVQQQKEQQQQQKEQQQKEQQQQAPAVVTRVSNSSGSRRAFSQAFCRLTGIETSPEVVVAEEELAGARFPAYTPPLSRVVVQQKRRYWFGRQWTDTDVGYLAFFAAMHAAAVIGAPLTYTGPECLRLLLGGYVLTGMLGISMSYHRQLSHKAYRCPKPLEYFLAYCGALAFEGDPIEWSKGHVHHHRYSDTSADRHSPRDGIWHSHMGWLFDSSFSNTRRNSAGAIADTADVDAGAAAVPWFVQESPEFYGWLRDTYMGHMLGQMAFFALWSLAAGSPSYFVWGFVVRVLVTMHMTWLVNSAVHVFGEQAYASGDDSRNNWLVGLLVFGDGFHNNHHAFPSSAFHGLEWFELDASGAAIRALEALGLAWDVRRPTEAQKRAKRLVKPGRDM